MKKVIYILAIICLISCKKDATDQNKEIENQFTISGNLINSPTINEIILYDHLFNPINISVDASGSFSDTLSINRSQYYNLSLDFKRYTVFVSPNHDLHINYTDDSENNSIVYEGSLATINNYLVDKEEITSKYAGDLGVLYGKAEAEFEVAINKIKEEQSTLLSQLSTEEDAFKSIESKALDYQWVDRKSMYPRYHGYFTKNLDYTVPEGFLNDIDSVNTDNEEDAFYYSAYRNLAYMEMNDAILKDDDGTIPTIQKVIDFASTKNSSTLRDVLLMNSTYLLDSSLENLDKTYTDFIALATDETLKTKISEKYDVFKKLAKGAPSPTFDYENYKGGNTALTDLKGKYVYIDVWATWCGPCIAEIPSLKKIEHDYEQSDIEFVSISIDEKRDYETWRTMIQDKELGGIQLMSDLAWKSQFVKNYAIEGIPHFILLDPEGNIVNANADRPSSPKLAETFESLGL